jgi:hypothetical protein
MDSSTKNRLAFAGVSALTVLTWYALPDAVRSRPARTVIKAGLLGVTAAGVAMIPQIYPEAPPLTEPKIDLPRTTQTALLVGAAALTVAGTIWGEKAIYARGERTRAEGVRCAHTPAAVALAAATGLVAVVPWPTVVRRVTQR